MKEAGQSVASNGKIINGGGETVIPPNLKSANNLQKRLGFTRRYSYKIWLYLSIIMILFSLIHLPFIEPDNFVKYKAAPGEAYWYRLPRYRYGMAAHLATVLPAGLLAPIQFVPAMRRPNRIIYHRINGYLIVGLMTLVGIPGGLVVVNHSFGGGLDIQLSVFVLGASVFTALGLGIYNIRKLQIDQHRKWMLRAMVWMAAIVTDRLWMIVLAISIPNEGFHAVWTCDEARFTELNSTVFNMTFPQCQSLSPDAKIIANARLASDVGSLVETASALRLSFGTSIWQCLAMHMLATEIYLALTKDEGEKLRRIAYALQQKAGFKRPGSEDVTADRLGSDPSRSPAVRNVTE